MFGNKISKRQLIILLAAAVGLILMVILAYLQYTGYFKQRDLPPSETVARLRGDDVEQVKEDMQQSQYDYDNVFKFSKLIETGLPTKQLNQLKYILLKQIYIAKRFYIDGEVSVSEKTEEETGKKLFVREFTILTDYGKKYQVNLSYYDGNEFFTEIKNGDEMIYPLSL